MARVHIGDEIHEVDFGRMPLHEALALQRATGMRPPQLAEALQNEDLEAVAALAWLILRFRVDGHADLTFQDITEGRYEIDLATWKIEAQDAGEPDPTGGDAERTSTANA